MLFQHTSLLSLNYFEFQFSIKLFYFEITVSIKKIISFLLKSLFEALQWFMYGTCYYEQCPCILRLL